MWEAVVMLPGIAWRDDSICGRGDRHGKIGGREITGERSLIVHGSRRGHFNWRVVRAGRSGSGRCSVRGICVRQLGGLYRERMPFLRISYVRDLSLLVWLDVIYGCGNEIIRIRG
jgi:hypothetical protein